MQSRNELWLHGKAIYTTDKMRQY